MRTIRITQRQARFLTDILTNAKEGYHYVELLRLDTLAKRLVELQGGYATELARIAREARTLRRQQLRTAPGPAREDVQRLLVELDLEVADLNDEYSEPTAPQLEFTVEDADYKLITDRVDSIENWSAAEDVRSSILAMIRAVKEASSTPSEESVPAPTPIGDATNGKSRHR